MPDELLEDMARLAAKADAMGYSLVSSEILQVIGRTVGMACPEAAELSRQKADPEVIDLVRGEHAVNRLCLIPR